MIHRRLRTFRSAAEGFLLFDEMEDDKLCITQWIRGKKL